MYITLEADYAVRIVNCLAKNGSRMDAKALSAATGVTLRFSLKILRKLVAQGIVRSYKGTQGGYELARAPQEIPLGEVIETVEGPITISRCVGGDGEFQVDGQVFPVGEGSVIRVSPAGRRSLRNTGDSPMTMICIQYKAASFDAGDAADGEILPDQVVW